MYVEIIMNEKKNENKLVAHFNGNIKEETSYKVNIKSFKEFISIVVLCTGNIPDADKFVEITAADSSKSDVWHYTLNTIYEKHKKAATPTHSDKFATPVSGTSKLVRLSKAGVIKIAYRTGKVSYTSADCVCISDDLREAFFADVKRGKGFKETGKYCVYANTDPDIYKEWDGIMKTEFASQYKKINS